MVLYRQIARHVILRKARIIYAFYFIKHLIEFSFHFISCLTDIVICWIALALLLLYVNQRYAKRLPIYIIEEVSR